jgi:mono/diheme cytochrome c family protein
VNTLSSGPRERAINLSPRLVIASAIVLCVGFCLAQNAPASSGGSRQTAEIARGKYLVEGVARCGQCHTPRDENGNPDRNHWLEGAAVWLKPAEPTTDWPLKAPRLAGTLPSSDADMIHLLTTGIWRNGQPLRQPMPQFHMSREDAQSVVAYLRSLSPPPR